MIKIRKKYQYDIDMCQYFVHFDNAVVGISAPFWLHYEAVIQNAEKQLISKNKFQYIENEFGDVLYGERSYLSNVRNLS